MLHSPSSVSTAEQCRRKWWLRYREKIRQPELTWKQIKRGRVKPRGGQRGAAIGKEVHRLAEIYLTVRASRVARRRLIDWNDLPGQCLQELIPLLPPAGSVSRKDVERRVTVVVDGVRFQGLIDLVGSAAARVVELYDHKSTSDIRAYALLPDAVAVRTAQPKRSLKNDLQACLYTLARATESRPVASGGLCRWNYTETGRSRRSLPVVQYVPTSHAHTVASKAARVARECESFRKIEDAKPDTTACADYGGCWYRYEGHCTVPRQWGSIAIKLQREQREKEEREKAMGKGFGFKQMRKATDDANAKAEAEAARVKVKAKAAESEEDDADEDDEAPESEAKPAEKRKRRTKAEMAAAKEPPATVSKVDVMATTAAPDFILRFFAADGYEGEAKLVAQAFAELAENCADLPRNPERAHCLRRILEARDCAVRALEGGE